ncbi:SCP2 sterol-binding domain-containing protein [Solwaraspora sp. WMMD406]|uniref:SCP2 sterol-binding domain-containing protein n=1 Tax=Solwaraspora sp. WMMD406 TaxID=3016095 RepID=UPI002416209D|nr:SCP2 sterol-binding domain-containing protein [Solwaraspora sp. WMMD406]MDG4765764.1 SCP2 sterol-binding domain-containing protein [Solwaraspora sp. WMMD406]
MSATARAFFAALDSGASRPVPPGLDGTLRFDVRDDDRDVPDRDVPDRDDEDRDTHWRLRFHGGQVHAEESDADADCVVSIDSALFDRILRGEERIEPAFIRYAYTVEGLFPLLLGVRWILPDTVGARRPRELTRRRPESVRTELARRGDGDW